MSRPTDIQTAAVTLHYLPIKARRPIKFGHQVVTHVTCARVNLTISDRNGRTASGWGETPLAVEWSWPSQLPYEPRHQAMRKFCERLCKEWSQFDASGHAFEVGHDFLEERFPRLLEDHNASIGLNEPMPRLAALVCASAFDIALHDAYGVLHDRPIYSTYNAEFLSRDLSDFFCGSKADPAKFAGKFPADFLVADAPRQVPAWHLVGGLDPIETKDIDPQLTADDHPTALVDWIRRDGLTCLKVKLRGNDQNWDYDRLFAVGQAGLEQGVEWLTADFNCTVTNPAYVNEILDRLLREQPRIYQQLLYVEQPFPYDLEANPIDVRSVSARKPLFMDESAHDWQLVEMGRDLGWSGVALKTCKTQTGALLSLCWAKAHDMPLMVQDLANPMLAQIPHVLLSANAGTIMGVETNGSQFFPDASLPEAKIHPGLFRRRNGSVDLSTLAGPGFGYRIADIARPLDPAAAAFSR